MKKNNLITLFIITLGISILSLVLPWWASIIWIIIVCIVMNVDIRSAWWVSGISMVIVWLLVSIYFKSEDQTDLVGRTGSLLGGISGNLLVIVTVIIGFISGALAGWFGSACALILHRKKTQSNIKAYTQGRPV